MVPLNTDKISARQLYALLFTALLAPMVRALPGWTAGTAGVGAWLTGLLAFPPLLLEGWLVWALLRRAQGGGLARAYQDALGPVLGKGAVCLYLLWGLFLLALSARLYAERMLSAGYQGGSVWAFLAVLLGLVLWMGRRKLSAFARAAEIFYLVLSLALGLVLLFSILDVTPEHVLPIWFEDAPGILAATAVPVGVLSAGVFAGFVAGQVRPGADDRRRGVRWLAALCVVAALLQFGVLAQLGPQLSARMEAPFFEVARGVGVSGAFQRVESLIVALWVFSDFVLLGLLVFALRAMVGALLGGRGERYAPWAAVGLGLLGAVFLFPDGFSAKNLAGVIAPLGNLALGFVLPGVALAVGRLRK